MVAIHNDSLREAAAGAFAGAFNKTLLAPLDRLKLVVQLRGSLGSKEQARAYSSPWSAFRRMLHEEGALALWRGNVSMMMIEAGTQSLNFMFMDWYKTAATNIVGEDQHELTKSFLSAALAGGTAITFLYPIGLARTKLALDVGQEQRKFPNGMRDVVRYSVRMNGITSLYQGYGVALCSVSLYRMVHLGGYDYIKTELCHRHGLSPHSEDSASALPVGERLLAAQFVSMSASTIHYPLDSVRRRLMMESDAEKPRYRSAFHCMGQIYQNEGIGGYFRGLGTNYFRSVGAAVLLVSYDFFNSALLR